MTEKEKQKRIKELYAELEQLEAKKRSDWHAAFEALLRYDTRAFKDQLRIQSEVRIGIGSPRVDYMILFEDAHVDLGKSIFKIFRNVNILEYKNPEDDLNERVVRKVCGYANLYLGINKKVPVEQVTVSIFRAKKNYRMFPQWEKAGIIEKDTVPGIYHVKGFSLPCQIIITSELEGEEYTAYRALSNKAPRNDVDVLVEEYNEEKDEEIRGYYNEFLKVIVDKNPQLREIIRRDSEMSKETRKFFFEVYKDDIDEAKKDANKEGKIECAKNLIALNELAPEKIAAATNLPLQTILELAGEKSA